MRGNGGLIGQPNVPTSTAAYGCWGSGDVARKKNGQVPQTYWPALADPNFSSVTGLWHFNRFGNGTILDTSSAANHLTLMGGANVSGSNGISTGTAKFGLYSWQNSFAAGGGLFCTGSGTSLTFGTGDFTFELWINGSLGGTLQDIVDFRTVSGSNTNPLILVDASNHLAFWPLGASATITGATTVTTGAWHHIHATRISGVTYLGMDGVQEGSDYSDSNNYAGNRIQIGLTPAANLGFVGNWMEVRVTKGVARYARTYTVPTAPFPDY